MGSKAKLLRAKTLPQTSRSGSVLGGITLAEIAQGPGFNGPALPRGDSSAWRVYSARAVVVPGPGLAECP